MASSKVRSGMGIELPAACQIRIMSGWFGVRGGSGMVSGKPCRRKTSRGEKKRGLSWSVVRKPARFGGWKMSGKGGGRVFQVDVGVIFVELCGVGSGEDVGEWARR